MTFGYPAIGHVLSTRVRLVMFLVALALAAAAIRSLAAQAPTERWLLVYDGDPRVPYPAAVYDRSLRGGAYRASCTRPLFTGVVLLSLKAPRSDHWFVHWVSWAKQHGETTGDDWSAYLDELGRPGGVLARLDSSAGRTGVRSLDVAVMVPPLGRDQTVFDFAGTHYDFRTPADRALPSASYLAALKRRFAELHPTHLRLTGAYWLREDVDESDTLVLPAVARIVHAAGLRFLWIPYFTSQHAERWRAFGFDEAFLQPNYFFTPTIPRDRVDSTMARAARAGMGLELEFDKRLFTDSLYRPRLDPYLDAYLATRPSALAVYEGGGALAQLVESRQDPPVAQRVVRLLCGP